MHLLMLCEGDAEAGHGSWSGSAHSLLSHLRAAGHRIRAADTELYGLRRLLAAAATFAPDRRRWGVRFRLDAIPAHLRSSRARRHIRRAGRIDAILQVGATFEPLGHGAIPYYLYCDSNIKMAAHGRASGQSQAVDLRSREMARVVARERRVYEGARTIFTLSERLRQSFIEDFGLAPSRVRTVYAGPNLDPGAIPPRSGEHRTGPPTILFVGVKFQRKGGDLLLKAFAQVRRVLPDARLLVVGPRHGEVTEPGVEWLGFLSKDSPEQWDALMRAYASADVFCLPTRFEPFGIVFVEAMFFGLPCVGPRAWAVPEIIADGETGFLCQPDDVNDYADRLLQLLGDQTLAARMGAAGRARAARLFTWTAVAERMTAAMEGPRVAAQPVR